VNTLCDTGTLPKNDPVTEKVTPAEGPGKIYSRILVGTDYSAASAAAFDQALRLARQNGAELLIAHAVPLPSSLSFMPEEAYSEWENQSRAEAEEYISPLIREARQAGVKAHKLLLKGLVEDALVEAAEKLGVDLIVIGTCRRRAVSRLFLGNIAARVVSRAPCAVLTALPSRRPPGVSGC